MEYIYRPVAFVQDQGSGKADEEDMKDDFIGQHAVIPPAFPWSQLTQGQEDRATLDYNQTWDGIFIY